jgi:glycolate oxidase FAD binding subunit
VVKNVAGYDMNKLYVGSFGTLAVVTELVFKLRPLAEMSETVAVTSKDPRSLARVAGGIRATLDPVSLFLVRREGESELLVRFMESEAAVKYQVEHVLRSFDKDSGAEVLDPRRSESVWKGVADVDLAASVALRLSVPVSMTADVLSGLLSSHADAVATADFGTGIIRVAFDSSEDSAVEQVKRLRADAVARGGSLFIERAEEGVRRRSDAWGEVGPTAAIMKAIKMRFDPQGILNPGRFV